MKRSSIFLAIVFQYGSAYCQELPTCVNSLVSKIARQQKKNSCGGSDKLLRIEEYSYNGTLLYKLVFEKKNICPDYVSNTIFYGSDCQAKIQLLDGGLKYRHQVLPATVNEKEIKFIKNIDWEKSNPSQSSVDNTVQLKVDVNGNQLKTFFLGMNVENLWIAGSHINWETGAADKPEATSSTHTHCSAFVAAACKKLTIYILRPPEHKQELLSNAQFDWMTSRDAVNTGWRAVQENNVYEEAQSLANKGMLVIAICKNPDDSKPGHVALLMPAEINKEKLAGEGPSLIMAGTHNYNKISLKAGFKSHLNGWPQQTVKFYYNINKPQFPAG